jgi:hypothetical protein
LRVVVGWEVGIGGWSGVVGVCMRVVGVRVRALRGGGTAHAGVSLAHRRRLKAMAARRI